MDIGAKAGENMTMQDMQAKASKDGKAMEGDRLDVFLTWEGSDKKGKVRERSRCQRRFVFFEIAPY